MIRNNSNEVVSRTYNRFASDWVMSWMSPNVLFTGKRSEAGRTRPPGDEEFLRAEEEEKYSSSWGSVLVIVVAIASTVVTVFLMRNPSF